MKKLLFAATLFCLLAPTQAAQWSYEGQNGPEHWGALSPDYSACHTGRNQSPVNIQGALQATTAPLVLQYDSASGKSVVNNGHTIQVDFGKGNALALDEKSFDLVQIHFHAPAENKIDGHRYPLEAHFVHADQEGNLAVVGVMFDEGSANTGLARIWSHMPATKGLSLPLQINFLPSSLLPSTLEYYRYNGSLTTPPCSEGVRWLVLKTPVQATAAQIQAFEQVMGYATNRPIQPLNSRIIVE